MVLAETWTFAWSPSPHGTVDLVTLPGAMSGRGLAKGSQSQPSP